jgi:hypothetical protein
MKRTTITISFTRTQNLGNYSNIKPGIVIGAELEEGDDPEAVKAQLRAEVTSFVYEAVDSALEDDGQPARFSAEPRYRLGVTSKEVYAVGSWSNRATKAQAPERLLVLVPDAVRLDETEGHAWWGEPYGPSRKLRLSHARRAIAEYLDEHPDVRLIDCADGDLSHIPTWVITPPQAPEPTSEPAPDLEKTAVAAEERTRFVGVSEFEALAQDDDEDDGDDCAE